MHTPFDNDEFYRSVEERIHEIDAPWGMCNAAGIMVCLNAFHHFMLSVPKPKNEAETKDYNSEALMRCSLFHKHLVEHKETPVSRKAFLKHMRTTLELMSDSKIDVKQPGIDQMVVRLMMMIRFQDQITAPDYYALFVDDFDKNSEAYEDKQ